MTNLPIIENTIGNTVSWFKKAIPDPTKRNFETQLGVHFEEVKEMLDELQPTSSRGVRLLENARHTMNELANELKAGTSDIILHNNDRKAFFDSICDQLVTATGTAVLAGMDPVGGLDEVNRSNWSKFDANGNPIFNETTGKIMKSERYTPPDLTSFI